MEMRKTSRRRPLSGDGPELGHFTLLFVQESKEMYKILQPTRTAIVLLIEPCGLVKFSFPWLS